MRRRRPESGPDDGAAARWAQEAAWWAERAQVDQPLTLDEYRRYDRLTHQRDDVDTAIHAVLDASLAAPAVLRSASVHARAEYVRLTRGSGRVAASTDSVQLRVVAD